jgi:hypothetical protein
MHPYARRRELGWLEQGFETPWLGLAILAGVTLFFLIPSDD